MRFWRLLFGRRGADERAAISPPSERAPIGSARAEPGPTDGLDVFAPAVSAPVDEGSGALETEPAESSAPGLEHAAEGGADRRENPADVEESETNPSERGAAPEPATEVAEPGPEPEISPIRLDAALQRLREENPASSGETPSDPSD